MPIKYQIYLLLILAVATVQPERNFKIIGKKLNCYYNTTWIESNNCFLQQRENKFYGFFYLIWKSNLDKLFLRAELDVKYKSTARVNLINFYTDICPILDGLHKSKLFELVLKYLEQTSNTFPKCPLKGLYNYSISNLNIDEEDLPANIPHGPFFIKVTYYKNKHVAGYLDFVGEIARKK